MIRLNIFKKTWCMYRRSQSKMAKIIDLTLAIQEVMAQHPAHGRTPLFMSSTRNHELDKGLEIINPYDDSDVTSFENENIIVCGHTGTHMDSCYHFDPESELTIEKMPIDCGFGSRSEEHTSELQSRFDL